jgi:hypothetical protein
LPTSVEPVNESLRTIGFDVSSPPISDAEPVTTLKHALRHAGALGELASASAETASATRASAPRCSPRERRAGLARDHRQSESSTA